MAKVDDKKTIRCSFCGKPQTMVERLIAGNNAYICDECIHLCMEMLEEDFSAPGARKNAPAIGGLTEKDLPKPADITKVLDE